MVKQNDAEMTRLEELRLQRELKEVLLESVVTLYCATPPDHHGFGIMVCRHHFEPDRNREQNGNRSRDRGRDRDREEYIMIRAIVYTGPQKREFKLLAQSNKAQFSITPALQEFSKELEREMGLLTGSMNIGEVWRGPKENLLMD